MRPLELFNRGVRLANVQRFGMSDAPHYILTVEPDKVGPGWHVRVMPPIDQSVTVVSDFKSEAEAQAWVDNDSADWIERLEASRK